MVAQLRPPLHYLKNGQWLIHGRTPITPISASFRLTDLSGSASGAVIDPSFTVGVTFPDATNTGLDGTALAVVNGDLALTNGQHLSNLEIRGFVTGTGTCSLTNCWIRGRLPSTHGGANPFRESLVTGLGSSPGFQLIRCLIEPQTAAQVYYMNGIGGANVETTRCEIRGCVDSIHSSSGDNFWDNGSWMHDLAFYLFNGTAATGPGTSGGDHATDTRWAGATHNDHFQALGGTGHRFEGTRMDGTISRTHGNPASCYGDTIKGFGDSFGVEQAGKWGSCFTITPKASTVSGYIRNCWLDGTEVQFQMPQQGAGYPTSGNNWEISGNRLGMPHPYSAGTRFEHMRMTSGMGIITMNSPNVYGNFASVNTIDGTFSTTPLPVANNPMPGTLNPLSYTSRRTVTVGSIERFPANMQIGDLTADSGHNWVQIFADDFSNIPDLPIGSFSASQSGELLASCAAYPHFHNKWTFYPDDWNTTHGGKVYPKTSGEPGYISNTNDPNYPALWPALNSKYYPSKTLFVKDNILNVLHSTQTVGGVLTFLGANMKPKNPAGPYLFDAYYRVQYFMRSTDVIVDGIDRSATNDFTSGTDNRTHAVPLGIASNDWPMNGEIDWTEGSTNRALKGNWHPATQLTAAQGGNVTQSVPSGESPYNWHSLTIEWTPTRMQWWCNTTSRLDENTQIPNRPMAWQLQHEMDWRQAPAAALCTVQIKSVSIWKRV